MQELQNRNKNNEYRKRNGKRAKLNKEKRRLDTAFMSFLGERDSFVT